MTSGISRRIFIVGCPRSGTTLVQSLLASQSEVTSFTESHFFSRHFTPVPWPPGALLTKDASPRVAEFLSENGEAPLEAGRWFEDRRAFRLRPILPFHTRAVARHLLAVLDALALRRGKPGWIEKTPMHVRRIPLIEDAAGGGPRPHFVHVIRNGVDAASSLQQASRPWERPYDLRACAARWNHDVALSLGRIGSPVDHFVFYEDLTARPEPAIRRLLAALGLEWESEVLERYSETAARVTTAGEAWKAGTAAEIRPSTAAGRSLSASDRERLARWLRSDLYDTLRARVAPTTGGLDERA